MTTPPKLPDNIIDLQQEREKRDDSLALKTGESEIADWRAFLRAQHQVPKAALNELVLESVEAVAWPRKYDTFGLNASYRFPSILLMILEVSCYAQGIYESAQVETAASQDPLLGHLFTEQSPNALLIRRFRRDHHREIQTCLLTIFDLAFRVRFGQSDTNEAPIDYCVVNALDAWFEPICGPRPDREAAERIDQAVFWDGMAMTG